MTTHDAPEAALAAALRESGGLDRKVNEWSVAAAILAAMPGWTLVPKGEPPPIHVYPVGEGHEMSENCWCHPKVTTP